MRSLSVREIPRPDLRSKLLDGMTTHDIPADALRDLYVRALVGGNRINAGGDTSAELEAR